jgi:hypothetical protein
MIGFGWFDKTDWQSVLKDKQGTCQDLFYLSYRVKGGLGLNLSLKKWTNKCKVTQPEQK